MSQQICAHCYNFLDPHRRQREYILCTYCESLWLQGQPQRAPIIQHTANTLPSYREGVEQ